VTVMMWVRWTLPRLRIDQVITTCLKYCVPIAALAFLGATLWQYALPNRVFFGAKAISNEAYRLEERWPSSAETPAASPAPKTAADSAAGGGRTALADILRTI